MKIAFDIGGVLSKYPKEFKEVISHFAGEHENIFIITDQHPKQEVLETLRINGFDFILADNVYCADYAKYGEMCKAIILRDLKIDILVDDFMGYLQWDYSWGKAPLRLLVMPDAQSPYWKEDWELLNDTPEFGRRVYSKERL